MRIAVISDIHGNCFALDAALADLRQYSIDQIVCLGDAVQGGAQPTETINRLRGLKCPIVMGNADDWLLTGKNDSAEPTSPQMREVRAWMLSRLSSSDLDFMRSFLPTVEVKLDSLQRLLCFHGSPNSYDDVLLPHTPNEEWQRLLGPFSPAIMTGGHTHTQQVRRIGEGLFFNPGSIGMVYNCYLPEDEFQTDPWAEYAIFSYGHGNMSLNFRRVPYDLEQFFEVVEASGRPHADSITNNYRRH